jgi:DNA-binding CsgD family transcriptional regulator
MTLWQQLQVAVEGAYAGRSSGLADERLLHSVKDLSAREGHPPDEMILILLDQAVNQRRRMDRAHRSWDALSPREKQVAALVCEGLTGRQAAAKLFISPETVKTHVRHILRKFSISSRGELRRLLAGWDLSPWLSGEHSSFVD